MGMKPLTLESIARAVSGRYVGDCSLKGTAITGVVRDHREAFPGCLFVCIRGKRFDGHNFANPAFDAGAACCLAEREIPDARGPYVLVDSTLQALKKLGAYYRSLFDIPVVGVTGSVGKTTAKEMISAVLRQKYAVLKTPENLNNEIGVPLTLLSLKEEHTAAVIEMGISDFGEMSRLAEMVRPNICVITAIGRCHLETLGDLNGVLKAKSEVFSYMGPGSVAVLNGDDKLLRDLDPGMRKVTFGLGKHNDFYAVNITPHGTSGISCDIVERENGSGGFRVFIPAFGEHMALSALSAAAVGRLLGLHPEDIRLGLLSYTPVGGRANVVDTGFITLIDDCYNANPESMAASIRALCTLPGRKVAILGDMMELGSYADDLHREIGILAGKSGISCLICCGLKAEHIFKGLISTKAEVEAWHFPLMDALLSVLPSLIKKGDCVLVKASHGMRFEKLSEALKGLR